MVKTTTHYLDPKNLKVLTSTQIGFITLLPTLILKNFKLATCSSGFLVSTIHNPFTRPLKFDGALHKTFWSNPSPQIPHFHKFCNSLVPTKVHFFALIRRTKFGCLKNYKYVITLLSNPVQGLITIPSTLIKQTRIF